MGVASRRAAHRCPDDLGYDALKTVSFTETWLLSNDAVVPRVLPIRGVALLALNQGR